MSDSFPTVGVRVAFAWSDAVGSEAEVDILEGCAQIAGIAVEQPDMRTGATLSTYVTLRPTEAIGVIRALQTALRAHERRQAAATPV